MSPLRHPLNAIPVDKRVRVFLPLLVATLLITFAFRFIGPAPPSIVDFELAGSVQNAQAIIDAWNETDRIRAGFSLGFDYLYMPVYATTIALACVMAAGVLSKKTWHRMGILLAWGLWAAAIFDATENLALFTELLGDNVAPYPQIALLCATIKFGLILLGLLYVVAGGVLRLIKK
jgi:hypothetical protein